MTEFPTATHLGPYEIVGRVGAGGMGEVYRARDQRLERDVAIKVLPQELSQDQKALTRFRREAKALAALSHPNILTVHDIGEHEGQVYVVVELLEGKTLRERIAGSPLTWEKGVEIITAVTEGLTAAHSHGIIHRDLKPENIFITVDERVKILDFGLAKRFESQDLQSRSDLPTESQATACGTILGTVPYMSPEQARGEPLDPQTDIFSAGTVLYELLTGKMPFAAPNIAATIYKIIHETPPAPSTVHSELPKWLDHIAERALAKDKRNRYSSAAELTKDLEQKSTAAKLSTYPSREDRPRIASLAVLPLANFSGDPGQDYFVDGMTEALITDLAKVRSLKVISRTSVMQYKGVKKPLKEIAHDLGVEAIVEGSVLQSGARVRISAQLIEAATDTHLWAESYEREITDVLGLQSEVARSITQEVRVKVTPQEQALLAAESRKVNPKSYEAYLKGRFYLNKFTPEGFEKGLRYLHQAVEYDPADPLPYAGLALGYSLTAHEAIPENCKPAKAAALRALELDPNLIEARLAIAEIKLAWDWDWAGAERDFENILEENPSLAEAHAWYSFYHELNGRVDESLGELRQAMELDPLTPLWPAWLGWQHWDYGHFDQAIVEARKSLELNPDFPWGLYVLGAAYAEKKMYKEAIAAHQKAAAASPTVRWALGHTYAVAGWPEEALKIANELKKDPMPMDAWGLGQIYTALGDKDEAFRWLEVAYERRFTFIPWLGIAKNGMIRPYAPLHGDPRFEDILSRMKLPG